MIDFHSCSCFFSVLGDQQAALVGQQCLSKGTAKSTLVIILRLLTIRFLLDFSYGIQQGSFVQRYFIFLFEERVVLFFTIPVKISRTPIMVF